MERQSKEVLQQVSAGIEYDDKTSTFKFTPPDDMKEPRYNKKEYSPVKPEDKTTVPETSTETDSESTSQDTETTAVITEPDTTSATSQETTVQETEPPEEITDSPVEEVPEPVPDEPIPPADEPPEIIISPTSPPQTEIPPTEPNEEKIEHDDIDDNKNDDKNDDKDDNKNDDKDDDKNDDKNDDDKQNEFPFEPKNDDFPQDPEKPDYDPYSEKPWSREDEKYDPWHWYYYDDRKKENNDENYFQFDGMSADTESIYSGNIIPLAEENEKPFEDIPPQEDRFHEEEPWKNNRESMVPRSIGSIDFFILMADNDGNYLAEMNNNELDEETAQKYITAILEKNVTSGRLNNYQFNSIKKSNGTIIVFTDKSAEIDMLNNLMRTTVIIGIISIVILSIASYFLSGLIVKPIKTAFEKQKQFISDASHELKTPLAVISANVDVLSGEIGGNKWLDYIQDQTGRMSVLVNELLNLTRLENNTTQFVETDFDLSSAIENTALPFECRAFEENRTFEVDIEEGLNITGSEQHIKQMAAIFIDNALKYSNVGGIVRVTLKKQNDKKVFSVYNTGTGVKEEDKEKIFERFYRSDESRNRATGGYGLGLAIAKSIIDKHKFKINVENDEGHSICFVITM